MKSGGDPAVPDFDGPVPAVLPGKRGDSRDAPDEDRDLNFHDNAFHVIAILDHFSECQTKRFLSILGRKGSGAVQKVRSDRILSSAEEIHPERSRGVLITALTACLNGVSPEFSKDSA